jgi:ATP-dependent 26S proteasome regulatory subunit
MDDAFTRRLNYIVHFPNPDEAQRLSIWKVLLPEKMPIDAQIDWQYLAAAYPIAGGNIRNVLVAAAYLAAQDGGVVRMDHILQAVRREMQKMGRLIREEDYHYTPLRQRGVHV